MQHRKRTSLDSLDLVTEARWEKPAAAPARGPNPAPRRRTRNQTVYLPIPVWEQLRKLAYEETTGDKKTSMHDLLMEGLDHVFAKRGLPSIAELMDRQKTT
jgi:hypothetical protein